MPSLSDVIRDYFNRDDMPNKFSTYMGQKIREAREEKGLSQEELAAMIYKRRASLSDMENGKMYADVVSFVYLAAILEKPIAYFILPNINIPSDSDLMGDELEVIQQFRRIRDPKQRKLAVKQIQ